MIAALSGWVVKRSGLASYLLIACAAALGLLLIAAGVRELGQRAERAAIGAKLAVAEAELSTLRQQVAVATEAATSSQAVIGLLRVENQRLAEQAIMVRASAEAAVAKARAAEADATRTLSAWMDKYAKATRAGAGCAEALVAMEAACSALSDY